MEARQYTYQAHLMVKDRSEYFLRLMQAMYLPTDDDNELSSRDFRFTAAGHPVCPSAFRFYHGMPDTAFYNTMRLIKQDRLHERNTLRTALSMREQLGGQLGTVAAAWLRHFGQLIGHKLPHVDSVRLPFREKRVVYEVYEAEMQRRHGWLEGASTCKRPYLTYSAFCAIWNTACPHVCLQRKKEGFCVCRVCAEFAAKLSKCHDPEETDNVKYQWQTHILLVRLCRNIYYDHQVQSRQLFSP